MKNTELYTHNSLYHMNNDWIPNNKDFHGPEHLGIHYFPSVYASALKSNDTLVTVFTGDRPSGVGSVTDGELDVGIGRRNRIDDHKGLPDGVNDKEPNHA